MAEVEVLTFSCPRCPGWLLEPCLFDGKRLDVCRHCGGLWCELGDWDTNQLGDHPDPVAGDDLQSVGAPFVIQVTQVEFQAPPSSCPACRSPLVLFSVTEVTNLRLDRCGSCGGVWFDREEWHDMTALEEWQKQRAAIERPTNWGEWFLQFVLRLPVEFNIKPRRRPIVTMVIVALCVLFQLLLPERIVLDLATHGRDSLHLGNLHTLLTYAFMHAGWVHLLGNMYLLYILGDNIEDVLGRFKYLMFYLACAVGAGLIQVLAEPNPDIPVVGASGAIAGVIAAYLILFRRARLTFMFIVKQFKPPAYVWIGIWILMQIAGAMLDRDGAVGVAWYTHIGGFITGLLLIAPFRKQIIAGYPLLQLLELRRIRA